MASDRPREGAARRSFRRKVEHLEELARQGNPAGAWTPKNIAEFVAWSDLQCGFEPWTSFSVASPNGRNADLRRRLDRALDVLRVAALRPARKSGILLAVGRLEAEVRALAQQNAELLSRLCDSEAALRREVQSNVILREREQQLLATLNGLLPLDRQLKSISPR